MNFDQLLATLRAGGALTVEQLRFLERELLTRAEAIPSTITAETSAADATRIEGEHTAALTEIAGVRAQIGTLEARAASPAPITDPAIAAVVETAMVAERQRSADIRRFGREFGRADELVDEHIRAGTSVAGFRSAILDDMATRSEQNPIFPAAQMGPDEVQNRRAGLTAALVFNLASAAGERGTPPDIARPWVGRDLVEIMAESVGHRGNLRTSRDVMQVFERAMLSTSDFPGIFTNALNVRLLARYQAAEPTYRRWAALYTAPDFRPVHAIRAGDFPALQPVNETGEIKSGSFSESAELFQVSPYAVMLNISRQMIINDNLNAIDQLLGSAGTRVSDWENAKAYTLLTSGASAVGPTLLTDSVAVFNAASHGNLAATPAAISVASIGIGRASMMKQTTLDGLKANFSPTTLLVGPDKLTEAQQIFATLFPALTGSAVPADFQKMTPVGDANLTGNGWYLFADPMAAPCFVYGFLQGFEGPRLASELEFDVQGMRVKLEHDFGVAAIDYRGGFRNAGA